jgi:hypothetical protein
MEMFGYRHPTGQFCRLRTLPNADNGDWPDMVWKANDVSNLLLIERAHPA